MVPITADRPADRQHEAAAEPGDELTAELTASYWEAYDQRLAETRFLSVARQLPELIGRAIRLAWEANRRDTVAAIALNVTSGVLTGFALLATTGVLEALFAAGPTPHRVRAALPSLILVAAAVAGRAGLQAAGGWAQARLDPQVERLVEIRLLDLTTQVELAAFDDAAFYDAMQRARDRGLFSAPVVVSTMFDCVTGVAGIVAAASVVAVLQPILLVLLLLAELPSAWAAVRSARIEYMTNFALADSIRRKWMLADLMADRRTAAEMRSFNLRHFMLARVARLAAYARDAQLKVADRQATTRVMAQAAGGIATAGVYTVLGILLAVGAIPLAVAGTAVLAIRSAQASLSSLLYAVNRCYEEGLYFSDYLAFCADAAGRIPAPGSRPVPPVFDRITADRVTFTYPGAARPALTEVSVRVGRGEVIALVGENGSGKSTLAKILAGLYRPDGGAVYWDGTAMADVDPEQLRELVAVIAQDHANWPLTVRHNIAMGRTEDPDLLAQAAAASGADSVIAALPRGYDTLLDRHFKNGAELSGGQWQRIAAARGFYRSAPLLIMDEPTAALDARAEYALFTSIPKHAEHRSVLLITHRLASVRHADRIYVLHHGQVIEEGTHTELLARGGQYAELFNLQASQYVALQPDPLGFAAGEQAEHDQADRDEHEEPLPQRERRQRAQRGCRRRSRRTRWPGPGPPASCWPC
jgi:ATP-binding cassette, subfamily B, bacterial